MKFNIGDRVSHKYVSHIGTIVKVMEGEVNDVLVEWDGWHKCTSISTNLKLVSSAIPDFKKELDKILDF